MAMHLRRAINCRNASLLLQSFNGCSNSAIKTGCISHACNSYNHIFCSETINTITLPSFGGFLKDSRRGFAKGKRSKDDSSGGTVEVPDIGPSVKAGAASQMDAAIVALSRELAKLRTGRASPGMLDHIIVEIDGVKMPLSRSAVVSVLDPKTLSVNPYDPNTLKALESAIVSSPFGLNPRVDGQRLIASIPPLTKEHVTAVCKVVAKSGEDVKQSIRRARQKALDTIKKAGSSFPKDEAKRLEKEIDDLLKKFIKSAEDLCKAKEKEIKEG